MRVSFSIVSLSVSLAKFDPRGRKRDEVLRIIKDAVCYNQGAHTEYSFLAAGKHRDFKQMMGNGNPDTHAVLRARTALLEYLNSELDKVFSRNFGFLQSYFKVRSDRRVRCCVKCAIDGKIVDIVRDRRKSPRVRYLVSSNTGFSRVLETGEYFLNNDLHSSVKTGAYKNPRLNEGRALLYRPKLRRAFRLRQSDEDIEWASCWEDDVLGDGSHSRPPSDSCYKSTLIVPMTLLNNTELSAEFRRHLMPTTDTETAIYGFLCMDHRDAGFFDGRYDIPVGYIFADIMSLYLLERLRYTVWSKSFTQSEGSARSVSELQESQRRVPRGLPRGGRRSLAEEFRGGGSLP